MPAPDPLSVGLAAAAAAKAATSLVTADPVRFPVCETVIVHDGRGFRWNRQLALHRLPDGRLEQKLVGRRRKVSPIEVVLAVTGMLAVVVILALILGFARLPG